MSALAEALLAAQRQAIGALSKAYVASNEDGDYRAGKLEAELNAMGCTDKVEQAQLLSALDVLREHGAPAPRATHEPQRSSENDLETEAQRKLIAKLADDRGTTAPDYKLTKANASKVIEELKAGTYDPDSWSVPF
jgi:hypothetical protein